MRDYICYVLQHSKVKFYIGHVRDEKSVDEVLSGVYYIFYVNVVKLVTLCSFFKSIKVENNYKV